MASSRAPLRGFLELMHEMERIRTLGRTGLDPGHDSSPRTEETAWVPTTDMFARGEDLIVVIELAGVPAQEIGLDVQDGVLTISGERPDPAYDEALPYLRERYYGWFRRSLALPDGIDEQKISAGFRDGLVTITLTGAARDSDSRPRRISIQED